MVSNVKVKTNPLINAVKLPAAVSLRTSRIGPNSESCGGTAAAAPVSVVHTAVITSNAEWSSKRGVDSSISRVRTGEAAG